MQKLNGPKFMTMMLMMRYIADLISTAATCRMDSNGKLSATNLQNLQYQTTPVIGPDMNEADAVGR